MIKSIIGKLLKINILYPNPQFLASVKKKQSKRKNPSFSAYKIVLWQQVFMVWISELLYSVFFMGGDYNQFIGFFFLGIGVFNINGLVYGGTGFFSVFYDNKETKMYLAISLEPQEIFLGKILFAQREVLTFLNPGLFLIFIN
ncbi:Predicted permease [Streptococcus suis 98HAH33]|nr:Predicted permease [Streptococcus suis 98HAH33]